MERVINKNNICNDVFWNLKNKSTPINYSSTLNWVTAYLGFLLTIIKFPLIFCLLQSLSDASNYIHSTFLILAFMALDVLDGEIFKLSTFARTHWGGYRRIIDASGDRIAILSAFTILTTSDAAPSIVLPIILFKEILLAIVTIKPFIKKKIVLKTNTYSKLATTLIGFAAIFILNDQIFLSYLCLVSMLPLTYCSYKKYDSFNKVKWAKRQ